VLFSVSARAMIGMMKRRELAQVALGTAVAHSFVTVLGCNAQSNANSPGSGHEGHAHHEKEAATASPVTAPMKRVAQTAARCMVAGETCLEHCLRDLSSGSTMMSDCARQVQQMLAICRSMSSLAAMGSGYAPEMAALCKKACVNCAAECKKHAGHHDECKACYEACQETIAALEALA
jgi:Cys-rich four helix bundle protein (predicted Tat secretion target)